jgi:hypothetical protein
MQAQRSEAALRNPGPRIILGHLVNVPAPEDIKSHFDVLEELVTTGTLRFGAASRARARDFIDRFGPLRPWVGKALAPLFDDITDVMMWSNEFRTAWIVPRTKDVIRDVNEALSSLFESREHAKADPFRLRPPEDRPILQPDFVAGKLIPIPRTLADALAIELLRANRALDRCRNPECKRLFVKAYSRDRHCSAECGDLMRGKGQRRWAEEHREELNRRRRKAGRKR